MPSVGVDRMLQAYRVRRPATVHQQNPTRPHGHGERGREGKLGALLLKDSRTTPGTNPNGVPCPHRAQPATSTSRPHRQETGDPRYQPLVPTTKEVKKGTSLLQPKPKDLMLSLQQSHAAHGIAASSGGSSFVVRSGTTCNRSRRYQPTCTQGG